MTNDFATRYGPWAIVAGGAAGMGATYSDGIAARGVNVIVVDLDGEAARTVADRLRTDHGVDTDVITGSLADDGVLDSILETAAPRDVGLLVMNAAASHVGRFADESFESMQLQLDVNLRAPLRLLHALLPSFRSRDRSGIVLMSSLSAQRGAPLVATYASTKAFLKELAESLWAELRSDGIDVLGVQPGSTRTPSWLSSNPQTSMGTEGAMSAAEVTEEALDALGGGEPILVPGQANRDSEAFLSSLTRVEQIDLVQQVMESMYPDGRSVDPSV